MKYVNSICEYLVLNKNNYTDAYKINILVPIK